MAQEYYFSVSFAKKVSKAYEDFYKKNQLQYCEGANEKGCPPNYIRSNLPRKKDDVTWFGKTNSLTPKGKIKD